MKNEDIILVVIEGKKTEPKIFNNLKKSQLFDQKKMIKIIWGCEIFQLYKTIIEDEFYSENNNFIDIFEIIKSKTHTEELLDIKRENISQIFLFFDHEGHSHRTNMTNEEYQNLLLKMLELFSDETENGKLYLSYPMVEAFKNLNNEKRCPCFAKIEDNIFFKHNVAENTEFKNLQKLNQKNWYDIFSENLSKASCLINKTPILPNKKNIENLSQLNILEKQYSKFIIPFDSVMILSCIPFVFVDYFGYQKFIEKLKDSGCRCFSENCSNDN